MQEQMIVQEPMMIGTCTELAEKHGHTILCGGPVMEILGETFCLETGETIISRTGHVCSLCHTQDSSNINFFKGAR